MLYDILMLQVVNHVQLYIYVTFRVFQSKLKADCFSSAGAGNGSDSSVSSSASSTSSSTAGSETGRGRGVSSSIVPTLAEACSDGDVITVRRLLEEVRGRGGGQRHTTTNVITNGASDLRCCVVTLLQTSPNYK